MNDCRITRGAAGDHLPPDAGFAAARAGSARGPVVYHAAVPAPAPTAIRVRTAERVLELDWSDGRAGAIGFRDLRLACPCAACVSETTGAALLDPATVPADVAPADVALAGNYALRVTWNDGHDTGLFTWPRLRALSI